jgi:hypothetical protein
METHGAWDVGDTIPECLPLVHDYLSHFTRGTSSLSDVDAVLIQHQVGSIVPLIKALVGEGLDPDRTYWVDIPYSSNARVRDELIALGIPAAHFSVSDFRLGQDLEEYQYHRVATTLERACRRAKGRRVLVLDDGAHALRASLRSRAAVSALRIVEQTARGMASLRKDPLLLRLAGESAVVNVAESAPKKQIEPPYIARSVLTAILRRLWGHLTVDSGVDILILGFGAIGAALGDELAAMDRGRARIHVVDPSLTARELARRRGFVPWPDIPRGEGLSFSLVVGCSGTTAFAPDDVACLADTSYLASASSGQHEFPVLRLAAMAGSTDLRTEGDLHADIDFTLGSRRVSVLNGGFPVNFDGAVNNIPAHYIQFTRVLMLAAALQVVASPRSGIQDVNHDVSEWLLDKHRVLSQTPGDGHSRSDGDDS